MEYEYLFSIVIPIYNSELWLREAIDSIINQTLDFNKIQLILVDDGSTDSSLNICKEYKNIYSNIEIIKKENQGVASARNIAISYIKGEYVQFLDSDDCISSNTLEHVYEFFERYKNEVNIVSIPMYYFEGRITEHYLNTKFNKGTRIVDLQNECMSIFVHVNSIFIKHGTLTNYRFDETLVSCEDSKFIIQLLIDNQKYGVLDNCRYNYRFRSIGERSLSQIANKDKKWYIEQLKNYPLEIYEFCINKKGYIPDFVKYIIASHLQWRFKKDTYKNILGEKEIQEYKRLLKLSIKYIDDYIWDNLTQITLEQKEYIKFLKNI